MHEIILSKKMAISAEDVGEMLVTIHRYPAQKSFYIEQVIDLLEDLNLVTENAEELTQEGIDFMIGFLEWSCHENE